MPWPKDPVRRAVALAKLSKSLKGNKNNVTPVWSLESRRRMSVARTGYVDPPEVRAKKIKYLTRRGRPVGYKMSDAFKSEKSRSRSEYIRTHSYSTRYVYREVRLRSTIEFFTARVLDELGIRWEYEPRSLRYTDQSGLRRSKLPDFYLSDLDMYLEVGMSARSIVLDCVERDNDVIILRWDWRYVMLLRRRFLQRSG